MGITKNGILSPLNVACILTFLIYLGIFVRIPIIPLYARTIGASTVEIGFIASSFMIIAAILAIPLGSLSDRFGRKLLINLGLILSILTSFLLTISQTPKQIMVIYAVAGLGAASFAPAMASYVGDITASTRMARAYGWYTSSMQIGMTSGLVLGGFIAYQTGYVSTFIFSGIIISVALLVAILELPVFSYEKLRSNGLERIKNSLKTLKSNRIVIACWLATLCIAFGFGVFQPFFPLYAKSIGLNEFYIGLLFATQSFFNAIARIPAGYLSDRLGKRDPFILGGMIAFAFSIAIVVAIINLYALIVLIAFLGLTMGIATMAISASLAESVKSANRGIAMGGYSTSLYSGFAVSAAIIGKIIADYGYSDGFLTAGIVCGVGAGLFYILKRF